MFSQEIQSPTLSECIMTMWRNWVVPIGLVIIIFFVSLLVPKYVVVAVCAICALALYLYTKRRSKVIDLKMLVSTPGQIVIVLSLTTIILFFISFLTSDYKGYELSGQQFNPDIPVVTPIIILFLTVAVTGTGLALKLNQHRMKAYQASSTARTSLTIHRARMLNREATYHARMLFWLSLSLLIIGCVYRLTLYINDSFTTRDIAVYAVVPALTFIGSLMVLALRYYALFTYYCRNDFLHVIDQGGATRVRYLIISDDRVFLRKVDVEGVVRYDTPIAHTLPYRLKIMRFDAITLLRDTSGLYTRYVEIMEAYESKQNEAMHNEFHFFCFARLPQDIENAFEGGSWYTLGNLKRLYDHGQMTPEFITEMHRITTIALAQGAYDRHGRRLHKIRNYRPTFRISDLLRHDIDFNDSHWLVVARLNQDKPFFSLRRIFSASYRRMGSPDDATNEQDEQS